MTAQDESHGPAVPGIAGRQIPGQPLPDHGKQEYDLNFRGGNFATPHPEFYKNTVLKDFRAPEFGKYDVLESVLPSARKRGLKTICWYEDVFRGDVPNIEKLQEKDSLSRKDVVALLGGDPIAAKKLDLG